jgi:hypothetical protein
MVLKVRQVFRGKRLELSRTDLFTLASNEFLLSTGKSRQCSGGKITAPRTPAKHVIAVYENVPFGISAARRPD